MINLEKLDYLINILSFYKNDLNIKLDRDFFDNEEEIIDDERKIVAEFFDYEISDFKNHPVGITFWLRDPEGILYRVLGAKTDKHFEISSCTKINKRKIRRSKFNTWFLSNSKSLKYSDFCESQNEIKLGFLLSFVFSINGNLDVLLVNKIDQIILNSPD